MNRSPALPDPERVPPVAQPPVAKIVPYTRIHLGHKLVDPYAWLQDPEDPDVLAYLQAENAYARAVLQPTEPLQERLVQEMRARSRRRGLQRAASRGEVSLLHPLPAGEQYRVFCRKHRSLDAPEQVLLDENELARGQAYTFVGVFVPSPDHRLLAYAVDTTGAWVFDLYREGPRNRPGGHGPHPRHRPYGSLGQ